MEQVISGPKLPMVPLLAVKITLWDQLLAIQITLRYRLQAVQITLSYQLLAVQSPQWNQL